MVQDSYSKQSARWTSQNPLAPFGELPQKNFMRLWITCMSQVYRVLFLCRLFMPFLDIVLTTSDIKHIYVKDIREKMSRIETAIILSDLHLGRESSYLYSKDERFQKNSRALQFFLSEIGARDEVIILGDLLELAVGSLDEVYLDAKEFFTILSETGPYKRIVFVPGNHDHHYWQELGEEACINERLRKNLDPPSHCEYTQCFVDKRFSTADADPPSPIVLKEVWPDTKSMPEIVVKYPHHFVTVPSAGKGDAHYFFTHGHFLEDLFRPVNAIIQPAHLEELEAFNNFWLESFDYHIGHAGRLSNYVKKFLDTFQEWSLKDNPEMQSLIDEIFLQLKEKGYLSWLSGWILKCFLVRKMRKISWSKNSGLYGAPLNDKLIKSIEDYIRRYILPRYQKGRAREFDLPSDREIPVPFTFVFGHTHNPIRNEDMDTAKAEVEGKVYPLLNSGGWLRTDLPRMADGTNAGAVVIDTNGARWKSLAGLLE